MKSQINLYQVALIYRGPGEQSEKISFRTKMDKTKNK